MLQLISDLKKLSYSSFMSVYEESNLKDAQKLYGHMDKNIALHYAQQDLYTYLESVFFRSEGSCIAVWTEEHEYLAALRIEPYQDGMLITALETVPSKRSRGYASALLRAVITHLQRTGNLPVYSHVDKNNAASMACHLKCGFQIYANDAVFIDGSRHAECMTLRFL